MDLSILSMYVCFVYIVKVLSSKFISVIHLAFQLNIVCVRYFKYFMC